jgi:hypothetical protein
MNDQELLMKLITEETYQDDAVQSSQGNLVSYFEKRLNEVDYHSLKNYLVDENILTFPLSYIPATGCYRLKIQQNEIDFPSNWSIFSKFSSDQLASIKSSDDEDFLCDIFLSVVGEVKIIVLACEEKESNIIFLNSDVSEKQLVWIENYFRKQSEQADEEKTRKAS